MCVFSYDLYFFFAHNIDVSAEGYKPSCNSLLNRIRVIQLVLLVLLEVVISYI